MSLPAITAIFFTAAAFNTVIAFFYCVSNVSNLANQFLFTAVLATAVV
jgi:hypothetical protein